MLPFNLKHLVSVPCCPNETIGEILVVPVHKTSMPFAFAILVLAVLTLGATGCDQAAKKEAVKTELEFKYQKAAAELAAYAKEQARANAVMSIDGNMEVSAPNENEKFLELRENQKRFLDELISVDPENNDYRFEMAKFVSAAGDKQKSLEILKELAPLDGPGYPQAHLVLSRHFFDAKVNDRISLLQNLDFALKHVDHVLTQGKSDLPANLLKARILGRLQRGEEAYEVYEKLFEDNPNFFRELYVINKQLGKEDRNQPVLEKALSMFQLLSNIPDNQKDERRWIVIEKGIAETRQKLGRFEEAKSHLEDQIATYTADPKGGSRRVFLQRLNAATYIAWADSVASTSRSYDGLPPATQEKLIDLYAKAYDNHRDNIVVLQSLARLSLSSNSEIAARAKTVYDPEADVNAPSAVLNQLGNRALLGKDFSKAIRYYERARELSPRDPAVLNNLAFSYLVAEDDDRNAERGLQLINGAIRNLPKDLDPAEKAKFLHTKATALKQMDRLQEAIPVFEKGLMARPNHADTLRSVVECYQGLNKSPPEQYVARLEKIDAQKRQKEESPSGP